VAVHGIFEIPNTKHQITNKSQIPMTNDLNYFDFCNIYENVFFNSFAILVEIICWFGVLNFGHWNLIAIWDLLFGISTNSTAP